MSVSKLESLPNEILIDILEKYINGVDIINAFAFQLNRRFDALIIRSQRLRFNFTKCHKDDFGLCLGLLADYANQIEQLSLAEQFTPGQLHDFLSVYPSFSLFKYLRKLYLQADIQAVDQIILGNALQSLLNMELNTLSIKILIERNSYLLQNAIRDIFYMKTLKTLRISCSFLSKCWRLLKKAASNIEYLTIDNSICHYTDVQYILQCAPHLRYLHIDILLSIFDDEQPDSLALDSLPQMTMLHTVLFSCPRLDKSVINELDAYFKCMPSLHHLEIKTGYMRLGIDVWETLIQTLLPSLRSFLLEITLPRITDKTNLTALALTETPFWIENKNFNLIIKDLLELNGRRFNLRSSYELDSERYHSPIFRWDGIPKMSDNSTVLNRISKLYLFPESHSLIQNHYLNNVTHLFVDNLDNRLVSFLITHINCSRIQHLDVSSTIGNNVILPLLQSATNIGSLRINLKQLHDELDGRSKAYPNVQSLDISVVCHSFDQNIIFMIRRIFPQLEHLIIYTKDLQNVPILETYLPRLRSLTFYIDTENSFEHSLRKRAKFRFQQNKNLITIWINQDALRDSYWRNPDKFDNSRNSRSGSLVKKTINEIVSFFK